MRIIAGTARGRVLQAPPGRETRPTSDRVRGALFSMLEARLADGLTGARILDLYAGSGALGLEGISRGAARAVAVDSSPAAQRVIRANAAKLGFEDRCDLLALEVDEALRRLGASGQQFEIVLADPPYADAGDELLEAIGGAGLLAPGGLLALEHSRRQPPGEQVAGLQLLVRRRHGDTELSLYQLS
jgi:16S rRNA (guanine966-N2)-methyltransferase